MPQEILAELYLGLVMIFANWPWLNERFLLFKLGNRALKSLLLCLLEWVLLCVMTMGFGWILEHKTAGVLHSQDWDFYAVMVCLFAVAAIPGFIYRYQWRHLTK